MAPPRVTVVRPYGERVRARVFALLSRASLEVVPDDIVPSGTSDADAIARVLASPNRILLVPFHAHRDASEDTLDGISFVRLLVATAPNRGFRVIMPVSRFAAAAVSLARTAGDMPSAVLLVDEDELADPGLVTKVLAHVG